MNKARLKNKAPSIINIKHKLSLFSDYWNPKIVGELNGQEIKVAKLKGEFVWHHHENTEELFLVIKGMLTIHFRDKDVPLNEGEFVIIPKMVEHKPEAKREAHIVLIESKGTVNTGNVKSKHTVVKQKKIEE
jgi:mannose-6-phosphate isomerase-like protein (cupin superfamily)